MSHLFRYVFLGCCIVSVFLSSCTPKEQSPKPPNIILIMADDLGYGGISCYGNTLLQTPNLDRLASEGLRFTDFHSNGSVCSPTRAALLTGRYQQRAGMEGVIYVKGPTRQVGLDPSETTIAEVLKAKGYHTGIMGKWHLGYQAAYNPIHQGFDEFYGYVSGNIDFHTHYDNAGIYDWWHNLDTISEEGYVTDLITDHSIAFIEKHQDEPFFLYVPHESPHVPFQGRNDPGYRFSDNEFTYYGPVTDTERAYKEMVEVMDEGIGRIMASVENLGLSERTLIIFISDNGAETFGHNGELNGSKTHLLEGGQRVPAIFHWKGKIETGISDALTMTHDLMPTILNICEADDEQSLVFDGIDLSHHLFEQSPLDERSLFWRYRKEKAVRQNEWKLYLTESDTMLFNLKTDLSETENLIEEHTNIASQLLPTLQQWEADMDQYEQKTW